MNTPPTIASVLVKLERPGALFAEDEMRVVVAELDTVLRRIEAVTTDARVTYSTFCDICGPESPSTPMMTETAAVRAILRPNLPTTKPRCPHGDGDLEWIDDQYRCPKCGDEWTYETIHGVPLPDESPPTSISLTGVELIAAERLRQIETEGWSAEHDDEHTGQEVARAAAMYALPPELRQGGAPINGVFLWPWENRWWKPSPNDRVKELVKAGALIAAEIDRLERASEPSA